MKAVEVCKDPKLRLAINLAFACSLRIGELLGLTWLCIDISDESIHNGAAYVYVNKELQRVERSAMQQLDELKKALGSEYSDYDLVFAGYYGMPTEASSLTEPFKQLIRENDLPPGVFHSLRHSSITYKLKLNGGDIKAVQGDSGHAQAKMVTDQHSHILDDDRQKNAKLLEKAFYQEQIITESVEENLSAAGAKTGSAITADDRKLLERLMSKESALGQLDRLAKDTAAKVAGEKPKTKVKAKAQGKEESL